MLPQGCTQSAAFKHAQVAVANSMHESRPDARQPQALPRLAAEDAWRLGTAQAAPASATMRSRQMRPCCESWRGLGRALAPLAALVRRTSASRAMAPVSSRSSRASFSSCPARTCTSGAGNLTCLNASRHRHGVDHPPSPVAACRSMLRVCNRHLTADVNAYRWTK